MTDYQDEYEYDDKNNLLTFASRVEIEALWLSNIPESKIDIIEQKMNILEKHMEKLKKYVLKLKNSKNIPK
jgi:citrate lyase synthetase